MKTAKNVKKPTKRPAKKQSKNPPALEWYLTDEHNKKSLKARVGFENGKICIWVEGYGDFYSEDGMGTPIVIDYFGGSVSTIIWSDINKQDPTCHVCLDGAKESNRKSHSTWKTWTAVRKRA